MEFTQISMHDPPSLPSCLDQVWFLWLYEQLPSALSENSTPPTKNTAQAELEVWRSIKKDSKRPCSLTHLEQKLIVQSPSFNAANICEQSTVAVPEANMLAARVVTMSSSHMLCLFEGKLGVIWST